MTNEIQISDLLGKRIIAVSWITDGIFVLRVEGGLKLACYAERGILRVQASQGESMKTVIEYADSS